MLLHLGSAPTLNHENLTQRKAAIPPPSQIAEAQRGTPTCRTCQLVQLCLYLEAAGRHLVGLVALLRGGIPPEGRSLTHAGVPVPMQVEARMAGASVAANAILAAVLTGGCQALISIWEQNG